MREFLIVTDEFRKHPDKKIILPQRATYNSAGYDFYSPISFSLKPGEVIKFQTDIKVRMFDYEVLLIVIRSSIGIKKELTLLNGTGVIDSDFFENPENDGNISIALRNDGEATAFISEGDRICQGIFLNYLTVNNNSEKELLKKRTGGIGSTN